VVLSLTWTSNGEDEKNICPSYRGVLYLINTETYWNTLNYYGLWCNVKIQICFQSANKICFSIVYFNVVVYPLTYKIHDNIALWNRLGVKQRNKRLFFIPVIFMCNYLGFQTVKIEIILSAPS
jgi:hypothetical protein